MSDGPQREPLSRNADLAALAVGVVLVLVSSLAIQLLDGTVVRVILGVTVSTLLLVGGALLSLRRAGRRRADAVLALGALSVFGWFSAIVTSIPAVEDWIASAPPAAAFLAVNATKLSSVGVLLVIMVGYGWSPRSLLITRGRLDAPTGIPHLGWAVAGPVTIVVVAVLFLTDPAVIENAGATSDLAGTLLAVLPFLVAGPPVNALSEELLYRHALIGTMLPLVGIRVALVASSAIFGLGHLTGSPGGWTGVLFTFVYGIVSGLAMLQNRGMAWNTTIHFFADLAAITAITIAGPGM